MFIQGHWPSASPGFLENIFRYLAIYHSLSLGTNFINPPKIPFKPINPLGVPT